MEKLTKLEPRSIYNDGRIFLYVAYDEKSVYVNVEKLISVETAEDIERLYSDHPERFPTFDKKPSFTKLVFEGRIEMIVLGDVSSINSKVKKVLLG